MQRYFLKEMQNMNPVFYEQDILHIKKVMRFKVNDEIELVFDNKLYIGKISTLNPLNVEIIEEIEENNELNGYIRLLYCIPKGGKIDLVIQKATELGVGEIVLINSSRTISKIDKDNEDKKLKRFNLIAKEAAEQSKRIKIPLIKDVIEYKDIYKYKSDFNFIAYENEKNEDISILKIGEKFKNKEVNILIGAEGGFSHEEVDYANKCGYSSISLGKRILRSETACISLISLLSFYMN